MNIKNEEIILALNQSADANKCGSCKYFERDLDKNEYVHYGYCKFKFPPTREFQRQIWDSETRPLDTVDDTDFCDLWVSSNKTYIVSQRIKP